MPIFLVVLPLSVVKVVVAVPVSPLATALSLFPVPLVAVSVGILHLALAVLGVVGPVAAVEGAIGVLISAVAMLFAVDPVTLEPVLVAVAHLALSMSFVVSPFARVDISRCVLERSLTVLHPFLPLPHVFVTRLEQVCPSPVFLSVPELSLVDLFGLGVEVNAVAVLAVVEPVPLVDRPVGIKEGTFAMLLALIEVTLIALPIMKYEVALAVENVLFPASHVHVLVVEVVHALPVLDGPAKFAYIPAGRL